MASAEVLVCVLGLSRGQGQVFGSVGQGVGKSCLCYRYLHPGFDDFISEHPSVLAEHEFQSAAVNNVHFLYWGNRRESVPGRLGKGERTVDVHVVENTVLYKDVTSKPFPGSGGKADNADSYVKRALGKLESSGKISYWTRDGISLPDTYRPQRYPINAGKMRRGFVVAVDVSDEGMEFDAQLQRAKLVCKHLKKTDSTFMLVATKMESVVEESLDKLHHLKKKVGADVIATSAMCNYNITATFRIIVEKILKTVYVTIPSFEQAAENELAAKTSAKRSFKNFATKWVQSSSEKIEDVERTEQYRTCKSKVGKYETDRLFAFKLLEVKNSEMAVSAGEDPARRRECLEDFIQTHPDLMLYKSQLFRKVEDLVVESLEQQQSLDRDSATSSSSPRTPRRVHHYPASDEGSKHSSTNSSPALKRTLGTTAEPPSKQLSIASTTSAGGSSAPRASIGSNAGVEDSISLGSFDSEDEMDYINMQGYRKGSDSQLSPLETAPPKKHTSSPALPLAIPSLGSHDEAVATGNEDDRGKVSTEGGSGRRSQLMTHEWVCLPPTPPKTTTSGVNETDGVVPSKDGAAASGVQDVPSENGMANLDKVAVSEEPVYEDPENGSLGNVQEVPYQTTASEDVPSGNGATTEQEVFYQNMSTEDGPFEDGAVYENTAAEPHDGLSGNGTDADRECRSTAGETQDIQSGNGTGAGRYILTLSPAAKDSAEEAKSSPIPPCSSQTAPNTHSTVSSHSTSTPTEVDSKISTRKLKPPPPAMKPKPPVAPKPKPKPQMLKRQMITEVKTNVKEPSKTPHESLSKPSTPKPRVAASSSAFVPSSRSLDDLSSSLRKSPTPPAMAARGSDMSGTEDYLPSSGDEYIPSDYDDDEYESERESPKREASIPENEPEPGSLPPPIPQRTKGYHLVVLKGDGTKSKVEELPIATTSVKSSPSPSPSSQTSPKKTVVFEASANPEKTDKGNEETKRKKEGRKSEKRRKRFYESWKLRRKEDKKAQDGEKRSARSSSGERRKPRKPSKPLQHTQSERQQGAKPSFRQTSSNSSRFVGRTKSNSLPRETFLNMRTRPLPQAPFVLPYEPPDEHTLADYDVVDAMLPSHMHSVTNTPLHRLQGAEVSPVSAQFSQQRRWHSERHDTISSDTMDYMNDDQFPRPSMPASSSGHLSGPHSPFSSMAQMAPRDWNRSPAQTPPHTVSRQPVMEPAHPPSVPHPLPLSAQQGNSPPRHLPLGRSTSNPHNGAGSPDYAYPTIPGMAFMRLMPPRAHRMTGAITPPRSRSIDFDQTDDYVQMKPQVGEEAMTNEEPISDEHYQNFNVIESIRAMKRSRSMEDVHLYKNFPVRSEKKQTVFDRTLPLPARSASPRTASHMFTLPPRNVLRCSASVEKAPGSSATTSPQETVTPSVLQSVPASMKFLTPQTHSPTPAPRAQHHRLQTSSEPHTRHTITTSPPHKAPPSESLPPHLEYFPKYKSEDVPPHSISPSLVLPADRESDRTSTAHTKKASVGTSTWTDENDPTADYYNVVSKSFLFKSPASPPDNSYLDILPD